MVETKGKNGPLPLEEIAQLFDRDDSKIETMRANVSAATETKYGVDVVLEKPGLEEIEFSRSHSQKDTRLHV